jgi:hypothetical protein
VFSSAYLKFKSGNHKEFARHAELWLGQFPIWIPTDGTLTAVHESNILSRSARYVFFEGEYLLLYAVSQAELGNISNSIKARLRSEMRVDYAHRSNWGGAQFWRMLQLSVLADAKESKVDLDDESTKCLDELNLASALNVGPTQYGYPLTDHNPRIKIDWQSRVLTADHRGRLQTIDFSIRSGIRDRAMEMAEFISTADIEKLLTARVLQMVMHRQRINSLEKHTQ